MNRPSLPADLIRVKYFCQYGCHYDYSTTSITSQVLILHAVFVFEFFVKCEREWELLVECQLHTSNSREKQQKCCLLYHESRRLTQISVA